MKIDSLIFDFTLKNIKKNFNVKEFVECIWEYYDDNNLIYPILDFSIYDNLVKEDETVDEHVNEFKEKIYSDFFFKSQNKKIKEEYLDDIFNGNFLTKISENFKTELYFRYKNESHYIIHSKFKNMRIYISCIKNPKNKKINSYIVVTTKDKINRIEFLKNYIDNNPTEDSKKNLIFNISENYKTTNCSFLGRYHYELFVKSYLPKINFNKLSERESLEIISKDTPAISDLPSKLSKNKNFILKVIKLSPISLNFVDDDFKKDKEIVFEAIKISGSAFQFADKELRKDKDFVLKVVEYNGFALQFVDSSLKKVEEIVLLAIKDCGTLEDDSSAAFLYADKNLKKNKKFILKALETNTEVFYKIDKKYQQDKEILKELKSIKQWDQTLKNMMIKDGFFF